jgi:GAF domain-containing protein
VFGALDIQSAQARAFDDNDIMVLQGMADQIAVALENARLFQQAQINLKEIERANRLLTQQSWAAFLNTAPTDFAEFHRPGVVPFTPEETGRLTSQESPPDQNGVVCFPLTVRDQVIGTLIVEQSADQRASSRAAGEPASGLELLEGVATQAAQAMETARLYQDAQRRAARERVLREISDRMQGATDIEALMRITAEELNKALGSSHAYVRLGAEALHPPNGDEPSGEGDD